MHPICTLPLVSPCHREKAFSEHTWEWVAALEVESVSWPRLVPAHRPTLSHGQKGNQVHVTHERHCPAQVPYFPHLWSKAVDLHHGAVVWLKCDELLGECWIPWAGVTAQWKNLAQHAQGPGAVLSTTKQNKKCLISISSYSLKKKKEKRTLR